MKLLATCTVLVMLSGFPALGQTADPNAASQSGPIDLSGFRDQIANKNKALVDKIAQEKLMLKKNAAIIDDAKKIDADNKRLDAERKQLDAQNAELERQQRAMMSALTDSLNPTPAPAPAPTYVAQPNPTPTRVETQPARVESQAAHMELANANVPQSNANNQVERSSPAMDPIVRTPPASQISQPSQASQPTQVASIPFATTATVVGSGPSGPMRVQESVAMGLLLSPIHPVYPQIAQNARIEGEVVLDAVISKDGLIESLRPISGPEMLRNAATDAVRRAHYQPYRVNGEAVEMTTTITVAFRMRS